MNVDDGIELRSYGRSTISEFLEDFIVYRGLNPSDPNLPDYTALAAAAGWTGVGLPRKHEPGYARLVCHLLQYARRRASPAVGIKRLIYLGDTLMSDGSAFHHLCQAGGWEGLAFICAEEPSWPPSLLPEKNGPEEGSEEVLFKANRWALLREFEEQRSARGFPVDEQTVVIVDLDKTALGGRGRNGSVIEQARQFAVQETVSGLLGVAFDHSAFTGAYKALNQPEFHPFTEDNQDYLAFICLFIASGRIAFKETLERIHNKELTRFTAFVESIEAHQLNLPESLVSLHAEFTALMKSGDPTPFKAFRRSEYRQTAARMGSMPDDTPLSLLLAQEIAITQEVRQAALDWKADGALVFGLSDKPDEASLPGPDQAAEGWLPLHRIETHIIGAAG